MLFLVALFLAAFVAAQTDVRYRREMNAKNWKRGILEDCDSGASFNQEFIEDGEAYVLDGFVPKDAKKTPISDVGVLVSIGYDLGNKNAQMLDQLLTPKQDVDQELIRKLTPYLGLIGKAAEDKLAELPLKLAENEEKRLADALKAKIFGEIAAAFNEFKKPETPEFTKLSALKKTLAMSLFSQQASFNRPEYNADRKITTLRNSLAKALLDNDYQTFAADLRQLGVLTPFRARRKKEVDLFDSTSIVCDKRMQVYFAVDESGSIGADNFELAKSTVSEFIGAMPDNQSNFGALFFNDDPNVCVEYGPLVNKAETQEKIMEQRYGRGGTFTARAIEKAISVVDPKREVLNPQIYLITDGQSEEPVTKAAELARQKMIVINAVGIGQSINATQLQELAFDSRHWTVLHDYKQMKCNVQQFISNLCFQPDFKNAGDKIDVDFGQKSNVIFGIKVPKSSNLRVTIRNTEKDACVVYGSKNIENPDELVSHYFHSGNSDEKIMVFKWNPDAQQPQTVAQVGMAGLNGLEDDYVSKFLNRLNATLTNALHEADDRLNFGKLTHTPDLDKDSYYAFINIYSKNAKKLTLNFELCKDGEANCTEGSNDQDRKISSYWYILPAFIILIAILFCVWRCKPRNDQPEDAEYQHI